MKKVPLILTILIGVVLVGVLIPLFRGSGDVGASRCNDQIWMLTPLPYRLVTLRTAVGGDGSDVIGSARTLFDIPLNHVRFPSLADCEAGTRAHISY